MLSLAALLLLVHFGPYFLDPTHLGLQFFWPYTFRFLFSRFSTTICPDLTVALQSFHHSFDTFWSLFFPDSPHYEHVWRMLIFFVDNIEHFQFLRIKNFLWALMQGKQQEKNWERWNKGSQDRFVPIRTCSWEKTMWMVMVAAFQSVGEDTC